MSHNHGQRVLNKNRILDEKNDAVRNASAVQTFHAVERKHRGLTDADIGAVGIAGNAGFNNGTYTVSGSGSDIWTAGDQFNFDYRSSTNNVTVFARVLSENGTGCVCPPTTTTWPFGNTTALAKARR